MFYNANHLTLADRESCRLIVDIANASDEETLTALEQSVSLVSSGRQSRVSLHSASIAPSGFFMTGLAREVDAVPAEH